MVSKAEHVEVIPHTIRSLCHVLETQRHAFPCQSLGSNGHPSIRSNIPSQPLTKHPQEPPTPSLPFLLKSEPQTLKPYYHDNKNRYPSVSAYYSPRTTGRPRVSRSWYCPSACSAGTCICSLRSGRGSSLAGRGGRGR